ncbi:roadblock/LC7 domain-containing protein [Methanofollis aquaemaris]|uniref:Roadblock/LC7 domain-containing protein n=1 Tax=Methanofollis aquaemaris TaxID=126734 RepID=A0A8A3S3J9_9EURY|nr:roadblock/LC7 domain-containing protein [Methanofollis aquaemaris]QSZ66847.1 roadblock/LC7 domain-containing protein [Methanofollis aquaemaris]
MTEQLGLKERINRFIKGIMEVEGVSACVLSSRDGILMGKAFPDNISVPSFAAMSATLLASAEAAASIAHVHPPQKIVATGQGTSMMVISAGERTLVAAILKEDADQEEIYASLTEIAREIAEVL